MRVYLTLILALVIVSLLAFAGDEDSRRFRTATFGDFVKWKTKTHQVYPKRDPRSFTYNLTTYPR